MAQTTDLTTLAALKAWLGSSATADEAVLSSLISGASADFLSRCDRPTLLSQTYAERYDGQGNGELALLNFPVTAVASVTVGTFLVPPSPDYVVAGWVFDRFSIKLVGGAYEFCRGYQNVLVAYTAGYAAIPLDVGQAVCAMCSAWFKRRGWTDQASKNLAGELVTFRREDVPPEVQRTIERYRRRIAA